MLFFIDLVSIMKKNVSIRFLAGLLAVTLLSIAFVSFSLSESASYSSSKTTVFIKATATTTTSSAAEPCEEKEGKDVSEDDQNLEVILFSDEAAFARLLTKSIRTENQSISSFGNTTNLPIYLAKRSFLI